MADFVIERKVAGYSVLFFLLGLSVGAWVEFLLHQCKPN
jgi:hypothetical protein